MLLPLAFALGINEAVTLPRALATDEALEERARRAAELTDLVRVQASSWPWLHRELAGSDPDWSRIDAAFQRLARHGLDAIVVLAPWPANEPWKATDDCGLDRPDAYARNVTALVERLDGDGEGDAADVRPVLAWEVDNEPDLHEWLRPGFCPPELYAQTFAVTAAAVRQADPDATVLTAGIYRPGTDTGLAWMRGLPPLDGEAAIHLYPGDEGGPEAVRRAFENVREVFGAAPVWVTEASTLGEGKGRSRRGEAEQARALVALAIAAYEAGAQGFFWHTLADPPVRKQGAVPSPGLLAVSAVDGRAATEWREKPAAEAFRRLQGVNGPVGSDGELRWVRVADGCLVWPEARRGRGRPPAPVIPIAGGRVYGGAETIALVGLGWTPCP